MPGRLCVSDDWGRELKRLLVAELSGARSALDDPDLTPDARVHAARRTLKRARSLLRLLKPHLAGDYERHRDRLKQAASGLSGTRDLDVMAATADGLKTGAGDRLKPSLAEIAATLARQAGAAHGSDMPVDAAIAELDTALAEAGALEAPPNGKALFEAELIRAYKAARRAMTDAERERSEDRFHDWRKRVKHQWHLSRYAQGACAATRKKTVTRLDELGELLGLEHDHAVLAGRLIDDPLLAGDGRSADRVLELIDERRARLQKKAFRIGVRLYAEPPKAFRKRIDLG